MWSCFMWSCFVCTWRPLSQLVRHCTCITDISGLDSPNQRRGIFWSPFAIGNQNFHGQIFNGHLGKACTGTCKTLRVGLCRDTK